MQKQSPKYIQKKVLNISSLCLTPFYFAPFCIFYICFVVCPYFALILYFVPLDSVLCFRFCVFDFAL
ncbi:hypothetical protein HFN_0783 [Helicobacter fennelliae MRY12-0050]|uniref:Uncharacterized protein n=1 Tax=Helicobacter fennelliae MRY12-0050 TaxID=1325130 RepID=T1DWE3_9HELI|nr:hypothetical protein HFN_0783 [Helicobacter fennelliae MRY12-0050]